jgi:hypothetical protein
VATIAEVAEQQDHKPAVQPAHVQRAAAPVEEHRPAGPAVAAGSRDLAVAAAAAGDPGGPGAGLLNGADRGARQRVLAAAQRSAGNAAVQRLVEGSSGAGAPVAQRQWGGGSKHTFKVATETKIDQSYGPVKLEKATIGGEATLDLQEGAGAQAGGPTQVRLGATGAGEKGKGYSPGVQAEVERAVGEKLTIWGQEFQPKVKVGGERTKDSGEIGLEGSLEGEWASTSVKFVVVGKDYEEGSLEIATLKWKVLELKKEFPFELLGKARKLELKGSVELSFAPDWARIGGWLLENLATDAAIEGAVLFGFLAGGAMVIGLYVYTIMTAGEIAERVDAAATSLRGATRAYKALMTGGENPGGAGADIGAREAEKALAQSRVPLPSVYEENKKKGDLEWQAYRVLAPVVRKAAIDDYWKEHWFERWTTQGTGGLGFHLFKMRLGMDDV